VIKETAKLLTDFPVIAGALIALLGVVLSALISTIISRRNLYLNAVTVERSKWIDKLRQNIADFYGLIFTINYQIYRDRNYSDTESYRSDHKKLNTVGSLIKLQLNPFGEIDNNIIILLDKLQGNLDVTTLSRTELGIRLIILHSQWLLKAEWEKVKAEAGGIFSRAIYLLKMRRLHSRYRKFCEGEGFIDQ
jgi:hypothetical protein